jgi:hypothetical protein
MNKLAYLWYIYDINPVYYLYTIFIVFRGAYGHTPVLWSSRDGHILDNNYHAKYMSQKKNPPPPSISGEGMYEKQMRFFSALRDHSLKRCRGGGGYQIHIFAREIFLYPQIVGRISHTPLNRREKSCTPLRGRCHFY